MMQTITKRFFNIGNDDVNPKLKQKDDSVRKGAQGAVCKTECDSLVKS